MTTCHGAHRYNDRGCISKEKIVVQPLEAAARCGMHSDAEVVVTARTDKAPEAKVISRPRQLYLTRLGSLVSLCAETGSKESMRAAPLTSSSVHHVVDSVRWCILRNHDTRSMVEIDMKNKAMESTAQGARRRHSLVSASQPVPESLDARGCAAILRACSKRAMTCCR